MAIIKRGQRYGVRVWDPARRRHRWLGTFAKLSDAKRAEADATLRPKSSAHLTVEQWAAIWLSEYARQAPYTQRTYAHVCKQIVRDLGHVRVGEVDRPTAKTMANRWARNTTRTARAMWADALRDGLSQHNPFTSLGLETPKGRKDLIALSEPEIAELEDVARAVHGDYGDEFAALVVFAAYTGVRPGELAALQWHDLDPANREATIRRALDGQGGVKPPKNGLERTIILPPPALAALGQVARRTDSPFVFHTPRGRRLTKGSLAYLWRPVASAWRMKGGRDLDVYELRHACATLLLERGLAPADVAVQLGHTDGGRLVMTLYGHPDERRARERLRMAFAAEVGHKAGEGVRDLGHISDASR